MELGIGAAMDYDESPNKRCSAILRQVYKNTYAMFGWTATINTITKIRRVSIARQAEFDRAMFPVVFFFLFQMFGCSFFFIHLLFFSFRSPFCTPIKLQIH